MVPFLILSPFSLSPLSHIRSLNLIQSLSSLQFGTKLQSRNGTALLKAVLKKKNMAATTPNLEVATGVAAPSATAHHVAATASAVATQTLSSTNIDALFSDLVSCVNGLVQQCCNQETILTDAQCKGLGHLISELGQDASVTTFLDKESHDLFTTFISRWNAVVHYTETEDGQVADSFDSVCNALNTAYHVLMSKLCFRNVVIYNALVACCGDPTVCVASSPAAVWTSDLSVALLHTLHQMRDRWEQVYEQLAQDASEPAVPIDGSYDPARFGAAYYFREDGKRVRNIRRVPEHDDKLKDGEEVSVSACSKKYPRPPGSSYVMFFFCPYHGHCWGFHIIHGGEGRKDVHSVLYQYLEQAPEVVYYDFACR